MGTQDHAGVPDAATARAGRVVAVDAGCFWCGLLDAADSGQRSVIADLSDTMSLTPRSLDILVYVAAGFGASRRLGVVASGPTRGMIEASVPRGLLDIVSSTRELAELWGTEN